MADIQTIWSPSLGIGDWSLRIAPEGDITDELGRPILDNGGADITDGLFDGVIDLQAGDDLFTAVLISLFTDATAGPDDAISDGSDDPRGWWGDLGEDIAIGSKVWLLSRSRQTEEVRAKAGQYIADALQWLITDGIAASIDVTTEWTRPGMLGAQIGIARANGTTLSMQADWAWKEIA